MPEPKFTCPYTGKAQTIEFDADTKHSGWHASGGFDPSVPFITKPLAEKAFMRRNGKEGKVSVPGCAYTGRPVTFMKHGVLWYAVGEFFRPAARVDWKEGLIYDLRQRPGKSAGPRPERPKIVVGEENVERSNPAEGLGGSSGDVGEMVKELVK